jgi:hypothetical protein
MKSQRSFPKELERTQIALACGHGISAEEVVTQVGVVAIDAGHCDSNLVRQVETLDCFPGLHVANGIIQELHLKKKVANENAQED